MDLNAVMSACAFSLYPPQGKGFAGITGVNHPIYTIPYELEVGRDFYYPDSQYKYVRMYNTFSRTYNYLIDGNPLIFNPSTGITDDYFDWTVAHNITVSDNTTSFKVRVYYTGLNNERYRSLIQVGNVVFDESTYRFNAFKDLAINPKNDFLNKFELDPTTLNPNKLWYECHPFVGKYIIVRLIFNTSGYNRKIVLHDVGIKTKPVI